MRLIEFTLVGGERISIDIEQIYSVCEIKPSKNAKNAGCKSNIQRTEDDKGWDLAQSYDEVLDKIAAADKLLDSAEE